MKTSLPRRLLTALAMGMLVHFGTMPQLHADSPIVDLGDLGIGDAGTSNLYINDLGQIAGTTNAGSTQQAFVYSGGTTTDLGNLGGTSSIVTAINASGVITGTSKTSGGETHAFIYSGGTMTDLGTLGGTSSTAYSINAAGDVVGLSTTSGGDTHVFKYSGGVMSDLGAPVIPASDISIIEGINTSGQIAGFYLNTDDSKLHGFVSSGGTITDISTLAGGGQSTAFVINEAGQVTGYIPGATTGSQAFTYKNGTLTPLGTISGYDTTEGTSITNGGIILGEAAITDPEAPSSEFNDVGFIYVPGVGMESLNALYAAFLVTDGGPEAGFYNLLYQGLSANDRGQIVGYGDYWTGSGEEVRAFLLNPVPEPSNRYLGLGLAGLAGLFFLRRLKIRPTFRILTKINFSAGAASFRG